MSFTLSRLMSVGTASYGAYALAEPSHLGRLLRPGSRHPSSFDPLAQTLGTRDLAIAAFAIFGRSEKTVTTAMVLRILSDLGDAAVLSRQAERDETRSLVLAATLGWASLNAAALAIDRRRAKRSSG